MFRLRRLTAACAAAGLALTLASCSSGSSAPEAQDDGNWAPVTIDHALGTTTIERKPERVASVAWGNHEVPLALGVVPVGMAKANFGDDDGDADDDAEMDVDTDSEDEAEGSRQPGEPAAPDLDAPAPPADTPRDAVVPVALAV